MSVLASGGFDPFHIGHLRYLKAAKKYGILTVALNSDDFLIRKKGFVFMPWKDRAALLIEYPFIDAVICVDDSDGTVCEALRITEPGYFANGGDRISPNPKEHEICRELGIVELFEVGGDKIESSSNLIKRINDHNKNSL